MMPSTLLLSLSVGALFAPAPPYALRTVHDVARNVPTAVTGIVSCDLDGDGVDELSRGCDTGVFVLAYRDDKVVVAEQFNLPPRFVAAGSTVDLGPAVDLDGDGRSELLASARTADGLEQRLWVLDPLAERILLDVPLEVGPDRRPDGFRDWNFPLAGVVTVGGRKLLVAAQRSGFDGLPRGIVAIDAATGAVVWRHDTACGAHQVLLADLDGDGILEIAFGESSGENLDGQLVRGRSDDQCWVQVVGADGILRWERRLGPRYTAAWLAAADLDGDGRAELATATVSQQVDDPHRLFLFDGATGDSLSCAPLGAACLNLSVVRGADGTRILCGLDDGRCVRFAYGAEGLRIDAETRFPSACIALNPVELSEDPGAELLLQHADMSMQLVSADLRPLAKLPALIPYRGSLGCWQLGANSMLVYANETNCALQVRPVPAHRRFAGPAGGSALVLGTAILGGMLVRQRRRLRRLRRGSRRDLLRAFLTARHGTVGPVGVLERVLWAAEHPELGGAARLHEAWTAARAEAVPDLQALLEKAAHVRLDPPLLAIVRRELTRLCGLCDELASPAPDDRRRDALLRKARTSLGLVADGVKSLGATLSATSRLDPLPVVRTMVERYRQRAPQVAIDLLVAADAAGSLCHADAQDLEFALDNLLDNAVQQLADAVAPAVTIAVAAGPRQVTVAVDDNGPGVPAAARERIFARGVSSKPDGGVGLWHSREALRYYGGDLTVGDAPAGGARFTLSLRRAEN